MWKNIVFFHVCWYSQSAADTSLTFNATRSGWWMNGKASTILNTSCLSELSRIRAAKTLKIRIALFVNSGSFWWCSYYSLQVSNVVTKHFQFDLTCLLFTRFCRASLWWIGVFCPMFCFPKCFPATLLSILRWNEIRITRVLFVF